MVARHIDTKRKKIKRESATGIRPKSNPEEILH